MDNHLAATYTLIHSFLTRQSHTKAAQALKKAARDIVVLKDEIDVEGPQLDAIIQEWKQSLAKRAASASKDSSSTSDSDSSSDSGSSDSSSDSDSDSSSDSSSSSSISSDSSSSSNSGLNSDSKGVKTKTLLKMSKQSGESVAAKSNATSPGSSSSSADPSSSDDSNSSDDEFSHKSAKKKSPKKKPAKTKTNGQLKAERDSSQTLSSQVTSNSPSSSDEDEDKVEVKKEKKGHDKKPSSDDESSSSSDSDSDSDTTKEALKKVKKPPSPSSPSGPKGKVPVERKRPLESSSSSSSDSEEEETVVKVKVVSDTLNSKSVDSEEALKVSKISKKGKASKKKQVSSSSSSSSSDSDAKMDNNTSTADIKPIAVKAEVADSDSVQVTKKRRTSWSGAAIITATTETVREKEQGPQSTGHIKGSNNNGKPVRKTNTPFQRVKPESIPTHIMMDNRYEVKVGPKNDYGQRAHEDLIVTRGAGFRKEKNKKKKGSYRGGEITMESHSFKFT